MVSAPARETEHGPATRAIRGAGFSVAGLLVSSAVLILATPVLLRTLGSDGYGIFTLALAVSGVLSVLDLGTGQAVTYQLSRARHDPSRAESRTIVQTGTALSLLLGFIGCILLAFTAPALTTWLGVDPASRAVSTATVRAAGLLLAVRLAASVLNGIFAAHQRFSLLTVFTVAGPTAATLGALSVAVGGGNAAAATLGAVVGSVMVLAAQVLTARSSFQDLSLQPKLNSRMLRRLWGFGGFASMTQICGVLLVQADKFIITRILGVDAMGEYAVVFGVAFRLQIMLAALSAVVFPMASDFARAADRGRTRELYAESLRLCCVAGALFLIPVLSFSHMFLTLWISPEFAFRLDRVLSILALSSFVLGISAVPHFLLNGLGLPHLNLLVAASSLVLSIAGNLVLAPLFGLPGAAAAALAAAGPALLLIPMAERSLGAAGIGMRILARVLLIGMASVAAGWWLGTALTPSWLTLIGGAGVVMTLTVGLCSVAGLIVRTDLRLMTRALSGARSRSAPEGTSA